MKWKALIIIALIALIGIVVIVYRPTIKVYSIPEPRKGFILGARTDNAFLFLFYEHPSEGEAPLQQYDTLYSNELTIYALAYTDTTQENLTFHMYRVEQVKQGNTTIEVKRDIQNITVTLVLRKYQIVKNVIELPTHSEKFTVEIYSSDNNMIFKFYHETHPLFLPAKKYTLGSLFMDRLAYILSALIICLASLGAAKQTVEKRKIVPRLSVGAGLWIMTVAAVLLYITARMLIYMFGLLNVAWTYIPIAFCSYVFGFSLLKPKTQTVYLMKTLDAAYPTKKLYAIEVVQRDGKMYLADISWKDFLLGKCSEVKIEGTPQWAWKIENTDDIIYIFKEINENENITIKLEGIHEIDVDKWMSNLKTTEAIAKEKEYFRKRLLEEMATKETEIDKRVLDFIKKYEEILLAEGT